MTYAAEVYQLKDSLPAPDLTVKTGCFSFIFAVLSMDNASLYIDF